MTTETEIERLARLLGWELKPILQGIVSPDRKLYQYPETNAELHMRWMVEHELQVGPSEAEEDGTFYWCAQYSRWGWAAGQTPHEAIRAALLAKLEGEGV